jgi:hypothetical protein
MNETMRGERRSWQSVQNGYGIMSWNSIDYTCEKCGCQFTENYETRRTVEIRKKGDVEEGA